MELIICIFVLAWVLVDPITRYVREHWIMVSICGVIIVAMEIAEHFNLLKGVLE